MVVIESPDTVRTSWFEVICALKTADECEVFGEDGADEEGITVL